MSTYLTITKEQAREKLLKMPFQIRHDLSDHPLFALDRLIQLAQSVDRDRIEYNAGSATIDQRPEDTPKISMAPIEIIRTIEHCNAWMVIKNVETDPDYRRVLEGAIADIAAAAGASKEDVSDIRGFIFVSSAQSTTPFHIDGEDNILLHIRGQKEVHVFHNEDRALVGEEAMEMSPDKHRNQAYREDFEERAEVFHLAPGEGVHIPYLWPHWVSTGNSYSISMAVTWKSARVMRLNKIRFMNGALRRMGLPQAAPGKNRLLDSSKALAYDAATGIVAPLRRSESIRRMLRQAMFGRRANYYYQEK